MNQTKVVYVPPPDRAIERFARNLCRTLSNHDPTYDDSDFLHGLTAFLKLATRIEAEWLNGQSNVTSQEAA